MQTSRAFKIVSRTLWSEQLTNHGKFVGSPVDLKDGFIHLSAKKQVMETATKWFKGQTGLILLCVDLTKVEGEVKWEPSRNNELFPHIYGAITPESVVWLDDFPVSPEGLGFAFPKLFQEA